MGAKNTLQTFVRPRCAGLVRLAVLAIALHTAPAPAAEDSPTISVTRLTMATALRVARTAMDTCREQGIQIGVTVVDRTGEPQVILRDSLAMALTLEISEQKAYTAMSFNTATSKLAEQFESDPLSVAKVDGVLPSAGGVPISAAGEILGGVGVSGAPSGATDEACARAGVQAVQFDLEMGGMN